MTNVDMGLIFYRYAKSPLYNKHLKGEEGLNQILTCLDRLNQSSSGKMELYVHEPDLNKPYFFGIDKEDGELCTVLDYGGSNVDDDDLFIRTLDDPLREGFIDFGGNEMSAGLFNNDVALIKTVIEIFYYTGDVPRSLMPN